MGGGDLVDVDPGPGERETRILVRVCSSVPELLGAIDEERSRRPLIVSLRAADCFIRKIAVPRSALFHLDKILELEIGRVTPFRASDVLSGWYELPEDCEDEHAAIVHVIARKELIWPIIAKLQALGRSLARVLVRDEDGHAADLRISLALPERPDSRRRRRLCAGLACTAAMLAAIAGGLSLSRQASQLALLDERLLQAQAQAKKVRDELDAIESSSQSIAALRKERLDGPSPLAVWAELTRLLPDNAWLADMAISQSGVTIDGTAQSAENLIALLDGSPMFEDVAFTGPVTKTPGGKLDRFSISLTLSKPATVAAVQ